MGQTEMSQLFRTLLNVDNTLGGPIGNASQIPQRPRTTRTPAPLAATKGLADSHGRYRLPQFSPELVADHPRPLRRKRLRPIRRLHRIARPDRLAAATAACAVLVRHDLPGLLGRVGAFLVDRVGLARRLGHPGKGRGAQQRSR